MLDNGLILIGIKPLVDCNLKFLKVLEPGIIYKFHQDYTIVQTEHEEAEIISFNERVPTSLYNSGKPKINICAIVGKNGSGKSSLMELLYVGLYNLSRSLRLVDKRDDAGRYYEFEKNVKFELYYCYQGTFYKIRFDHIKPELITFRDDGRGYLKREPITARSGLQPIFYSIVVNYSHYALNSEETGNWVSAIFHKNDAYQAPIVLNPFRVEGNIDVNTENVLVRSRLLVNMMIDLNGAQTLLGNRKPGQLLFQLNYSKFTKKKDGDILFAWSHDFSHRVLPVLFEVFLDDANYKPSDNLLNKFATEYILQKMKSITLKYKHYDQYRNFHRRKASSRLREFILALYEDKSHITFKLRQAIYFLRFDILPKSSENFTLDLSSLSLEVEEVIAEYPNLERIELVPPSFIDVDIQFSQAHDNFSALSSGEKQKIYSISSLIYHLRNLDSAHRNTKPLIKYRYVNVVFDEIELYYHPEFQRTFISDIINAIRKTDFSYIVGLNFIFITHSPFILSDIPRRSILFLEVENGKAIQKNTSVKSTFGANIHDLLATSFFMHESLMGEFARDKIQEAIDWCRSIGSKDKAEYFREVIALIDEPIVKMKLGEMYAEKMGENIEMARLEAQRDYILKRLEELTDDTNSI